MPPRAVTAIRGGKDGVGERQVVEEKSGQGVGEMRSGVGTNRRERTDFIHQARHMPNACIKVRKCDELHLVSLCEACSEICGKFNDVEVWKVECGGLEGEAGFLYCSYRHSSGMEDFVDMVKLTWSVEGGCVCVISLLVVFVECGPRVVSQDFDGLEVGCIARAVRGWFEVACVFWVVLTRCAIGVEFLVLSGTTPSRRVFGVILNQDGEGCVDVVVVDLVCGILSAVCVVRRLAVILHLVCGGVAVIWLVLWLSEGLRWKSDL
eukprot:6491763-Amphidinium_carterae.4